MKVMGIDGSTKSTGIAIIENNNVLYYDCIVSTNQDSFNRIKKMTNEIAKVYIKYKPEKIVMEDVLPSDVKNNQKVFKALIYLQASIVLKLHELKAPEVQLITASHWRKDLGIKTGRGVKRDNLKKEVMNYIKEHYGIDANNDVCDGIGVGLSYFVDNKNNGDMIWE